MTTHSLSMICLSVWTSYEGIPCMPMTRVYSSLAITMQDWWGGESGQTSNILNSEIGYQFFTIPTNNATTTHSLFWAHDTTNLYLSGHLYLLVVLNYYKLSFNEWLSVLVTGWLPCWQIWKFARIKGCPIVKLKLWKLVSNNKVAQYRN
jgi:hypothetical protein